MSTPRDVTVLRLMRFFASGRGLAICKSEVADLDCLVN